MLIQSNRRAREKKKTETERMIAMIYTNWTRWNQGNIDQRSAQAPKTPRFLYRPEVLTMAEAGANISYYTLVQLVQF
jgi:hypothetical protein